MLLSIKEGIDFNSIERSDELKENEGYEYFDEEEFIQHMRTRRGWSMKRARRVFVREWEKDDAVFFEHKTRGTLLGVEKPPTTDTSKSIKLGQHKQQKGPVDAADVNAMMYGFQAKQQQETKAAPKLAICNDAEDSDDEDDDEVALALARWRRLVTTVMAASAGDDARTIGQEIEDRERARTPGGILPAWFRLSRSLEEDEGTTRVGEQPDKEEEPETPDLQGAREDYRTTSGPSVPLPLGLETRGRYEGWSVAKSKPFAVLKKSI